MYFPCAIDLLLMIASRSQGLTTQHQARGWHTAVFFLLEIPQISVESLEESYISRWSLEVLSTILRFCCLKPRSWNLKYEHLKYENGRSTI